MKTGPRGITLIKESESFRARPYLCPAGIPTIGYGCTYYPSGKKVTLADKPITEHEACVVLENVLATFEKAVERLVKVALSQGEFDALVSFAYNVGVGNFEKSTLLRKLNAGDRKGAAEQFGKWVNSNGKVLPGLVTRRAKEKALFLGGV